MSQDEASPASLDFSPFIPRHFEAPGLVDELSFVSAHQEGRVLRVVFDGRPAVREGRFGVQITTPARVGDARWFDFPVDIDEPLEEWAKMAVILDLMEIYETMAPSCENPADADGIVWLS